MAKTLDTITLSIITFLLTFVWSTLLFSSWVVSLIFSITISIIVLVSVKFVATKRNKPYSYDRLAIELSVQSTEYLINLIKSTIINGDFESGSNYILLNDSILIASFRFNLLNINDLSNIYQLATKHSRKRIYVMARGIDRRAYQAISLQNVKLTVIKIKAIYKYLHKKNALPLLKKQKSKFSFSLLFEAVFQRANLKNYLFSGLILFAVAFLTPLKIYYLVFGSISLFLGLLTLTPLGKGDFYSSKVFDQLNECKSDQISIDELLQQQEDKDCIAHNIKGDKPNSKNEIENDIDNTENYNCDNGKTDYNKRDNTDAKDKNKDINSNDNESTSKNNNSNSNNEDNDK